MIIYFIYLVSEDLSLPLNTVGNRVDIETWNSKKEILKEVFQLMIMLRGHQ